MCNLSQQDFVCQEPLAINYEQIILGFSCSVAQFQEFIQLKYVNNIIDLTSY